ncbi:MAG TPA: ABC transporter ATP-binding protein [Bryobacteraceae bacterium]|nr:ABC transporter ATP-binding protein [Bryobacteraceae bacterium]
MKRWIRLFGFARPHLGGSLLLLGKSFVGVGLDLAKPWPMKWIIDSALSRQPLPAAAAWIAALPGAGAPAGLLAWLCSGVVVLFLLAWANRVTQAYIQAGVGSRMTFTLGSCLFERLQELSLGFHSRRNRGDLVQRVTSDSACLRALMFEVSLPLLTSAATLITIFWVMWRIDPPLALLAAAAAPLFGLCLRRYVRPMEERSYEQAELQGRIMAAAEQTLTALPAVRAFGREEHEDDRFSALCALSDRAYLRTLTAQLKFKFSTDAVMAAGTAAVMIAAGIHVVSGRLSIGTLFVFTSYLGALYSPLETLAYISQSLATASAGARRVFEIFDEMDEIREAPGAIEACAGSAGQGGRVRFEGATFAYSSARPAVKDVWLDAHPGEVVALVGATGAGKSTLLSLIPRFHDVIEGRVLFGGVDVRELRIASLRSQIAIVQQESLLFRTTVAENIAYSRPEAGHDEVIAAAVAANADGFIRGLPHGYQTVIGERGATLSGGERQRIAIARALLKNAPVLILDEPTASLDAQTEALILEALERLMSGRTTFVVAHRLSTIRRASRILVMDNGRVVESGQHEQLLAGGGLYARLHDAQFRRSNRSAVEALT